MSANRKCFSNRFSDWAWVLHLKADPPLLCCKNVKDGQFPASSESSRRLSASAVDSKFQHFSYYQYSTGLTGCLSGTLSSVIIAHWTQSECLVWNMNEGIKIQRSQQTRVSYHKELAMPHVPSASLLSRTNAQQLSHLWPLRFLSSSSLQFISFWDAIFCCKS